MTTPAITKITSNNGMDDIYIANILTYFAYKPHSWQVSPKIIENA